MDVKFFNPSIYEQSTSTFIYALYGSQNPFVLILNLTTSFDETPLVPVLKATGVYFSILTWDGKPTGLTSW